MLRSWREMQAGRRREITEMSKISQQTKLNKPKTIFLKKQEKVKTLREELKINQKISMKELKVMPQILLIKSQTQLKVLKEQLKMLHLMLPDPLTEGIVSNLKVQLIGLKTSQRTTSLTRLMVQRILLKLLEELQIQLETLLRKRKKRLEEIHMQNPDTLRTQDYSTISTDLLITENIYSILFSNKFTYASK